MKRFTLIELLVVIAIIAILAAMLLPSLTSAKSTAKAIKCAGSQRQLALAITLYSADFNNNLPYGAYVSVSPLTYLSWDRLIASYLGVNLSAAQANGTEDVSQPIPVLVCPEDQAARPAGYFARSYALNGVLNAANEVVGIAAYLQSGEAWATWPPWTANLAQVDPGTILSLDYLRPGNLLGSTGGSVTRGLKDEFVTDAAKFDPFPFPHKNNKTLALSHCDGHVTVKKMEETFGTGGDWDQPRGGWTRTSGD